MAEQAAGAAQATELAEALREIVRRRHVHFDVQPEVVIRRDERLKVGYEVRLWAIHPKGARALPGCAKCHELLDDLRMLATNVLPSDQRPTRYSIEPSGPALYVSSVVEGADEVSVSVRLIHRSDYERPIDACEERCLREIRQRLKALGAREA